MLECLGEEGTITAYTPGEVCPHRSQGQVVETTVDDIYIYKHNYEYTYMHIYISCVSLRTLNYGNDGIFLIMGNAGFISSAV